MPYAIISIFGELGASPNTGPKAVPSMPGSHSGGRGIGGVAVKYSAAVRNFAEVLYDIGQIDGFIIPSSSALIPGRSIYRRRIRAQ